MSDGDTTTSGSVHVVLSEGTPVFVSGDLDKCRRVAGEITAVHGSNTNVYKEVTCDTDAIREREKHG